MPLGMWWNKSAAHLVVFFVCVAFMNILMLFLAKSWLGNANSKNTIYDN